MAFADRGAKGDRWLICDNGRRGVRKPDGTPVCARHSMKYAEAEALILDNCPKLRPESVLPSPDQAARECDALRQKLAGYEAELVQIERQTANLVDAVMNTDDREMRTRYEAKAKALRERKAALEGDKGAATRQLADSERSLAGFAQWKKQLEGLREALAGGEPEVRLRCRAHLRELIERIDVFPVGFARRYDPRKDGPDSDVEDFGGMVTTLQEESDPDWRPDAEWRAFLEWVTARRMSREGRFIRVHFKTGASVDLAPSGSLATGRRLVNGVGGGKVWELTPLPMDQLWSEFLAEQKKKPRRRANRKGEGGGGGAAGVVHIARAGPHPP
jgi:hypothetical protein